MSGRQWNLRGLQQHAKERMPRQTKPKRYRIRRRWTNACAVTGQVACMDCIEGQCPGCGQPPVKVRITECDCGGHDVYGEMHHYDDCEHYVPEGAC